MDTDQVVAYVRAVVEAARAMPCVRKLLIIHGPTLSLRSWAGALDLGHLEFDAVCQYERPVDHGSVLALGLPDAPRRLLTAFTNQVRLLAHITLEDDGPHVVDGAWRGYKEKTYRRVAVDMAHHGALAAVPAVMHFLFS